MININDEELTVIDTNNKVKLDNITIHPFAAGALLREKKMNYGLVDMALERK